MPPRTVEAARPSDKEIIMEEIDGKKRPGGLSALRELDRWRPEPPSHRAAVAGQHDPVQGDGRVGVRGTGDDADDDDDDGGTTTTTECDCSDDTRDERGDDTDAT